MLRWSWSLITTSRARRACRPFTAIADASPIPIVVYNVPSRTVADISVETLGSIAKLPKIVAVKDATG
jgi:4-hydroxy-tetrahydrodipicolinate synthase